MPHRAERQREIPSVKGDDNFQEATWLDQCARGWMRLAGFLREGAGNYARPGPEIRSLFTPSLVLAFNPGIQGWQNGCDSRWRYRCSGRAWYWRKEIDYTRVILNTEVPLYVLSSLSSFLVGRYAQPESVYLLF